MSVYVGIDGGGSKTRTVAIDATGTLLLDHLAAAIDLPVRGDEHVGRVLADIREAVATVCMSRPIAQVTLGMPALGESDAWDARLAALAANAFPGWTVLLYNDARLALEGALPDQTGVLVVSGTGSIAWGKADDGSEARTGGWGPLLGDEGSGYDIGRRALAAAAMAEDGRGPATALSGALAAALGVPDVRATLETLSQPNSDTRARVASLAVAVLRAAEQGDTVAVEIIFGAGTQLATHVEALMNRLHLAPDTPVSYAGGCFQSRAMRDALDAALGCAGFQPARAPHHAPAFGGALLAGLALERLPADPRR